MWRFSREPGKDVALFLQCMFPEVCAAEETTAVLWQKLLCSAAGQFSTTLSKLVTTDCSFRMSILCTKLHQEIEAKIQELEG